VANSLGTLTLDLVARIGGFTGPIDKATRETKKFQKAAEDAGNKIGTAIGVGVTAAAAAFTLLINKQLQVIGDQADLALRLRTTTDSLGVMTRAAELSGVPLDSLTNGAQKLELALGKAAAGSKAQVEAFQRLGLSYQAVADLPIDERISTINQALVRNVPAYERAAVAATLFGAKNAAAFQQLDPETIAEANRQITVFGVKLNDIESAKVEQAGDAISIFGLAMDGVAKQITVELSPLLTQLSKDFLDSAEEAGGLGTSVQKASRVVLQSLEFVVNAGDGVVRVFDIAANTIIGLYSTAAGRLSNLAGQVSTALSYLPGDTGKGFEARAKEYANSGSQYLNIAAQAAATIKELMEKPLAGTEFVEYYDKAQAAAAASTEAAKKEGDAHKVTGEQFAAMTKKREDDAKAAAAASKQLNNEAASRELDYRRQIALMDEVGNSRAKATEAAKLAFDLESGKLRGLNQQQRERLQGLAAELDQRQALQRANEEAAKLAAYEANLRSATQTVRDSMRMEFAGAGSSDELKERLKQNLAIEQDYQKQREELLKQYNDAILAGDPEAESRYAKETALLSEALAERIVLQQDYYNQQDAMQADWLAGVSSAFENYVETASDYNQQAADASASILGDTTSGLSESLQGLATQTMTVGEAFTNLGSTMAGSVLQAIADITAQWLVSQALQLSGIAAITTATVSSESVKTAAKVTADATSTASTLTSIATTTTASVAAAVETLASWAPAALVASIGSFGAAAVVGGAALIAAFALIKGFETGGYTGDGPSSAPAGVVHKGEYVFTAAQTKAIGVDNLAALAAGYQDGGLVTGIPLPQSEAVTTAAASTSMRSSLQSSRESRGLGQPKVVLVEDAARAGQSRTRLDDDGINQVIEVAVSQIFSDGAMGEAISQKFGLKGQGQ
jgi:lambda family phage tail tape measure protein